MTFKSFNAKPLVTIGLAMSLLLLSGCFDKEIDESVVFKPREISEKKTDLSLMKLEDESSLTQPSSEQLIDARGFAAHLPASLEHGFWGEGEDRLAWTLVSSVASADSAVKRPLIVNCFGNTGDRKNSGVRTTKKNFAWGDVLLFDYPGYGDSPGTASTESMHKMHTVVTENIDKLGSDRPIILWGHSLGGFVCSEIARVAKEPDAIVLEATALNVEEVAEAWKPWYLPFVGLDIKDSLKDYDNARALAYFKGPVIVLGAKKDEMLPVGLARSLKKALKRRDVDVTYLEFKKAEHSTITDQFDFYKRVNPLLSDIKDLKRSEN
ncbi:alpha/beta hydrolase family protein [Hirschia baltica]|uniref:AB hydrolase-1 domain-containing protein n=1 Tax=Hirschia baltica (strain ATCC 49814 / DSM 5838 / IFAM 1418) TaxID=582402 RepID=C6XNB3_HIRBI|nr:alpha/beta hydrolase [Hirschia baltica]ACT60057.1 hypothetical protein Hbal_2377 [Hirschia baltica ATCC 49814]